MRVFSLCCCFKLTARRWKGRRLKLVGIEGVIDGFRKRRREGRSGTMGGKKGSEKWWRKEILPMKGLESLL